MSIRVTVWNEFRHEVENDHIRQIYPDGIHAAVAAGLQEHPEVVVRTATLDEPHNGLPDDVLDATDVLVWWGHAAHAEVLDDTVDRVQRRILDGMGLVALHSAHHSKIFKRMMGTSCDLIWRESTDKERIWIVSPSHPITSGIPGYFEIASEEMYGEHFDIPEPDELVMISWFTGGEVFRSGCCYHRGRGKIFYFRPGHETYPTYYHSGVRRVIANAVRWAAPVHDGPAPSYRTEGPTAPLEPLPPE